MSKDSLRRRIHDRMDELTQGLPPEKKVNMPEFNSITLEQLRFAVRTLDRAKTGPVKFGEYWSPESFARDLFNAATTPTETTGGTVKDANETLTVNELDDALRGVGYSGVTANQLYKRVLANRETWEQGVIVRSAGGNVYERVIGGWKTLNGDPKKPNLVDFTTPARPLDKIGRAL